MNPTPSEWPASAIKDAKIEASWRCDLPEGQNQGYDAPEEKPVNLREEVMYSLYGIALGGMDFQIRRFFGQGFGRGGDLRMIATALSETGPGERYEHGFDGVERTIMDADKLTELVSRWRETVVALSRAHDKATVDAAEFGMDDLLTPLLTIPGRQLKVFWGQLREALETDERVPFFIWKFFRIWEEGIIARAEEVGPVELKKELAGRIATMVEQDAKMDLVDAITGALQWRPQERLESIETAVKTGGRARLRGKESCLFLEIVKPAPLPEGCDETCAHEHEGAIEIIDRVML